MCTYNGESNCKLVEWCAMIRENAAYMEILAVNGMLKGHVTRLLVVIVFHSHSLSGKPIKSASFSPTSTASRETDWLEVQKMKLRERGGAGLNLASPTPLHPGATFRCILLIN